MAKVPVAALTREDLLDLLILGALEICCLQQRCAMLERAGAGHTWAVLPRKVEQARTLRRDLGLPAFRKG